ncbi:MAG: FAD-binding protein [Candidatus Atribacteria bacterium]|nr:FAD-binding protein [Candidatus Atribacteria bacterium]
MKNRNYELMVIGGGAAGLVASVAAGAIGVKTALVEKNQLGGVNVPGPVVFLLKQSFLWEI